MFHRTAAIIVLLGLGSLTSVSQAAEKSPTARLAHGRQIAENVCSACHVIGANQEFAPLLNPPAPAFADIAGRPDSTRAALRHFVLTTHWDEKTLPLRMPNPSLTDSQVDDVLGYLLSLRKP